MLTAILISIILICIITLSFSFFYGRNGVSFLILGFNFLFFLILVLNSIYFFSNMFCLLDIRPFCETMLNLHVSWSFFIDKISFFFFFIIIFITSLVLCFSISYMFTDLRFMFFITSLQFFMFFMLLLVLSSNLIQLFIGWEGVGILSFILINFWYFRLEANKGALKALIFNRIGDCGYFLFLLLIISIYKTAYFPLLVILSSSNDIILALTPISNWICIGVILAIFGKSAQLLLYAWLPDAMEGPTPVSSLLHSATMVTAGVYLLFRMIGCLLIYNEIWCYFIILTAGLSSVFCGLYALVKFDIKKIIAFSTCSQLGLMLCAICFGLISGSFFHLFIHAFFKALLFLSAGIIIHCLFDEQDIRRYGSVSTFIQMFYLVFCIGSLNIMGIFYFSGYYSKELLLLGSFCSPFLVVFKSLIFLSSLFTILYSIRFFLYLNTKYNLTHRSFFNDLHSLDNFILISVFVLSICSLFFGFFFTDSLTGLGNYTFYTLNLPSLFLNFELVPSQIIFLFTLVFIFSVVLLNTVIFLLKFNKYFLYFIVYINGNIIQEFQVQSVYWFINKINNIIAYKYINLIVERTILDQISLIGFIKLAITIVITESNFRGRNLGFFFINLVLFISILVLCSFLISFFNISTFILYYVFLILLILFSFF
jgi:NADH:ubiquinone oxidoreductase subunit 5 (subunit L)/multisubunit Na+/H+ antiporter MnhA subunit